MKPADLLPRWITPLFTLVLILAVTALGLNTLSAPAPEGEAAPPDHFSAARAMAHIKAIAQVPHPTGSVANAQARAYLIDQIRSLGLTPEVQTASVVSPRRGAPYFGATVHNVMTRIKGTGGGKAILVAAHYDSVANGPGASDDGVGVAAMLETMRVLRTGSPLQRDVIFLFTDAEEDGLLGGRAFAKEHPWVAEVGLVLNLEARGSAGPVLMFETSPGNGALIREFAKAAPTPVATSLSGAVYRLMPNDTDFTEFREAGLKGLNFAHIDNPYHYHTGLDSIENVDLGSLQHHGSYVLSLTRQFGNLDLERLDGEDAVYFSPFGTFLVQYPAALAFPLSLLAALLVGVALVVGLKSRQVSVGGVFAGLGAFLGAVLGAGLLVTLLWMGVRAVPGLYVKLADQSLLFTFSSVLIAVTAVLMVYAWLSKRLAAGSLSMGALLVWGVLAVASGLLLPGGSHLFTWPLLFAAAAQTWLLAKRDVTGTWCDLVALAVIAVPTLLLLAPTVYLVSLAFGSQMSAATAVLSALTLGPLVPHLLALLAPGRWQVTGAVAALALTLVALGGFGAPAEEHKVAHSIFYALNADTGRALWLSSDPVPDAWTAQFIGAKPESGPKPDFYPMWRRSFLKTEAKAVSLAAPQAVLLEQKQIAGGRELRLRVTSQRQGRVLAIYTDSATRVERSAVNGKWLDVKPASPWGLYYVAPPAEGVEVTLQVAGTGEVQLRVVDQVDDSLGLTGVQFQPRPTDRMPSAAGPTDATLVSKSFQF